MQRCTLLLYKNIDFCLIKVYTYLKPFIYAMLSLYKSNIREKFIFLFHLLKQLFYIFNALIFLIYNPLHMLLIHWEQTNTTLFQK